MAYEVGYKKPSNAAKWKKGFCPNPEGRGAGKQKVGMLETYHDIVNGNLEYSDGKRWKKAPATVVLVGTSRSGALKGDIDACGALLDLHKHARKNPDLSPITLFFSEEDLGVL